MEVLTDYQKKLVRILTLYGMSKVQVLIIVGNLQTEESVKEVLQYIVDNYPNITQAQLYSTALTISQKHKPLEGL